MLWSVLFLAFSCTNCLQSWDVSENEPYDILESWGVSRIKRDDTEQRITKKFPETSLMVCEMLHETDEAPFTAIILYRTSGRLLCMGSIVDNTHILSAKRCYEKVDVSDLKVLVGYYKAYWGRYSQVKDVNKILRHEYEVALLRLSSPLTFTPYVNAVRLPSSITKQNKEFEKAFPQPYFVVGFFVDRYDVPGDYIDKEEIYQIKEDSFVPFDECQKNYTRFILEPEKLFCVFGNASYCWGGTGGPVLKVMPTHYYLQVGVVVADNCTADTTGPFLVARTDAYADWIRGNSFHGHQPS